MPGVIPRSSGTLLRLDNFAAQFDQIPVERRAVQFFFPACNHDGGDAIANHVHKRAAGAHETLDSEEQRQARDWNRGDNCESCDQRYEGCA